VPTADPISLLDRLDDLRRRFGLPEQKQLPALLRRLGRRHIATAAALARYHESLLFLCAYPPDATTLRLIEIELREFTRRVARLRDAGGDLSALDPPEVSGVAGTSVSSPFSFDIVRWLHRRHASQIAIDWDEAPQDDRMAATWPRFLPLLEEDAFVEANVPYRSWLRRARGRQPELAWLLARFEGLALSDKEKAELFDALNLFISWTPSPKTSRTGMRLAVPGVFYHRKPLITRRMVSLSDEFNREPPPLRNLSRAAGERMLDLARATSALRYRELYGFTYGDPARVQSARIGRGVELIMFGLPPERRLPLRAYHAAMIYKNGVPVGYFEGLSLCERIESGFNFYYGFREGETAWIYARTLNVLRKILGVTAFSIDPYQIGHENEEGIESGAFWFYRKLGFRPTRPDLLRLTRIEEERLVRSQTYRTSRTRLRRLAAGSMIFELNDRAAGDWDRFEVRHLGFAVQRRMAERFRGEPERMREKALRKVSRGLGLSEADLPGRAAAVLENWSLILQLIPDLESWSEAEKQAVVKIIRAKAGVDETGYLRRLQRHQRLRASLIGLGSGQIGSVQGT